MNPSDETRQTLRHLPSVGDLLAEPGVNESANGLPREILVDMARRSVDRFRDSIRAGQASPSDRASAIKSLASMISADVARLQAPRLLSAINATGIIIHTGMGRSPLAESAAEAVGGIARGYSDIAIDPATGGRRKRSAIITDLLGALAGCEAALVVNNNAAGVLLALAAHAGGREVIVSRGQLVEIGGSFRLPDVMASAGVKLREVGTTNRTRISDYETAIGEDTAAIMRMHPSNYRIVGFTESVEIEALVKLGRERGIVVLDDVGSGALIDFSLYGLGDEPSVQSSVAAGSDIVLFSGDKLLGGPQAGILAGRRGAIEACARHPLMRALRVDKLTMAALEATLRLYLEPETLTERLPLARMIAEPADSVRRRARRLAGRLGKSAPELKASVEQDVSYVGGGSLPDQSLPTWIVAVEGAAGGIEEAKRRLRAGERPVYARARRDRLEFDLRTVDAADVNYLAESIVSAC